MTKQINFMLDHFRQCYELIVWFKLGIMSFLRRLSRCFLSMNTFICLIQSSLARFYAFCVISRASVMRKTFYHKMVLSLKIQPISRKQENILFFILFQQPLNIYVIIFHKKDEEVSSIYQYFSSFTSFSFIPENKSDHVSYRVG